MRTIHEPASEIPDSQASAGVGQALDDAWAPARPFWTARENVTPGCCSRRRSR